MKLAIKVLAFLIALLGIAAGSAKITLVPEEVTFLNQFGLSNTMIISFGVLQVLGGILLLMPKTRLYGAIISAIGFAVSVILLFGAGKTIMALISLIPFSLTGFIAYQSFPRKVET